MRRIPWRGILLMALAVLALPLTLALTGCGFQLRGQAVLPPELRVTYIHSLSGMAPPGAVSRKLPLALASNGVTITRDPAQATATVTILREDNGRRIVAADRFDIKRLYSIDYNVAYSVTLANGKTLIPEENMNTRRTLLFDENRVLGFESAQDSLTENMADDLTGQIIRRLQAVSGS